MAVDNVVMMIRNIKKDAHDQFKAHAAKRGRSMSGEIRDFIKAYVVSGGKVMEAVRRVK